MPAPVCNVLATHWESRSPGRPLSPTAHPCDAVGCADADSLCGSMAAPIQTCYRHPDRRAGVTCQRCDRPICPQCMQQASVGFHCPECRHQGRQKVYTAKNLRSMNQPIVTISLVVVNVGVYLLSMAH